MATETKALLSALRGDFELHAVLPAAQREAEQPLEGTVEISIVIPVRDEVESLEILHSRLHAALAGLGRAWEVIYVDDGSTDGSFLVLRNLHERYDTVRVVRLRRNFGQTAAFSAGFQAARGNIIVTLDADLQNDPADIPRLLEKIDEGYDVVSGWRIRRKDAFLSRRLPSQVANLLISKLTGVRLHDYGCSLKAYRSEVVKNIELYGQMHRFIPAIASWMGIQLAEVPVNHSPRQFGRSKYGLTRVIKVVLDLLTVKFLLSYSTRPIQIFGLLGALFLVLGTAIGGYLTVLKLFFQQPLADRPLLLLAVLLVMLGVQLLSMGLLGEVVVRTYYEARGKPAYMVREALDRADSDQQDALELHVSEEVQANGQLK
jgi:glycosyltransferase involved in cell wall biosynthesis